MKMAAFTWAVAAGLAVGAIAASAAAQPTELGSFSPGTDARFKTATVCHDISRDVYVVAAVFERQSSWVTYDTLYRARIEGSSLRSGYGELLEAPALVRSEFRIDNVDCTTDGAGDVFVAFDRAGQNAMWYRFDGTASAGPFEVARNGCNPYTHRPRVAYGSGRLMVAFEGFHYDTNSTSCEVCVRQFNALTGVPIAGTNKLIWNDNMTHSAYDVEWNGNDRFILALPYQIDAGSSYLGTYGYRLTGEQLPERVLEHYTATAPAYPAETRIIFSQNTRNPARMFVQTSSASYWTNTAGERINSPLRQTVGSNFALCEYWGADAAVGHLLTPSVRGEWVPGFPSGSFRLYPETVRAHYGTIPAPAYETSVVNSNYAPVACSGADTYRDAELFVVSKAGLVTSSAMTWNILPND